MSSSASVPKGDAEGQQPASTQAQAEDTTAEATSADPEDPPAKSQPQREQEPAVDTSNILEPVDATIAQRHEVLRKKISELINFREERAKSQHSYEQFRASIEEHRNSVDITQLRREVEAVKSGYHPPVLDEDGRLSTSKLEHDYLEARMTQKYDYLRQKLSTVSNVQDMELEKIREQLQNAFSEERLSKMVDSQVEMQLQKTMCLVFGDELLRDDYREHLEYPPSTDVVDESGTQDRFTEISGAMGPELQLSREDAEDTTLIEIESTQAQGGGSKYSTMGAMNLFEQVDEQDSKGRENSSFPSNSSPAPDGGSGGEIRDWREWQKNLRSVIRASITRSFAAVRDRVENQVTDLVEKKLDTLLSSNNNGAAEAGTPGSQGPRPGTTSKVVEDIESAAADGAGENAGTGSGGTGTEVDAGVGNEGNKSTEDAGSGGGGAGTAENGGGGPEDSAAGAEGPVALHQEFETRLQAEYAFKDDEGNLLELDALLNDIDVTLARKILALGTQVQTMQKMHLEQQKTLVRQEALLAKTLARLGEKVEDDGQWNILAVRQDQFEDRLSTVEEGLMEHK
ncbi:unnamed protein product [Amoebophrya sp. A25]|nr:unnamed protein product [Amoebophrya sp. A25]|eukprot:GSA25T00006325001.1